MKVIANNVDRLISNNNISWCFGKKKKKKSFAYSGKYMAKKKLRSSVSDNENEKVELASNIFRISFFW